MSQTVLTISYWSNIVTTGFVHQRECHQSLTVSRHRQQTLPTDTTQTNTAHNDQLYTT